MRIAVSAKDQAGEHGGFAAKFQVGVHVAQFQNGPIGNTNFCENDTLG